MCTSTHHALLLRMYWLKQAKYIILALLLPSCGDLAKPIDAETRRIIDSVATSAIQKARLEIDSLYKDHLTTRMPQVTDSIRQIRLREIEAQLKAIPGEGGR